MGFLNKVFGGGARAEERPETESGVPQCPHTALTPHWDNLEDMGKDELAFYTCESCGERFSYDDARILMENPPEALTSVQASDIERPA